MKLEVLYTNSLQLLYEESSRLFLKAGNIIKTIVLKYYVIDSLNKQSFF